MYGGVGHLPQIHPIRTPHPRQNPTHHPHHPRHHPHNSRTVENRQRGRRRRRPQWNASLSNETRFRTSRKPVSVLRMPQPPPTHPLPLPRRTPRRSSGRGGARGWDPSPTLSPMLDLWRVARTEPHLGLPVTPPIRSSSTQTEDVVEERVGRVGRGEGEEEEEEGGVPGWIQGVARGLVVEVMGGVEMFRDSFPSGDSGDGGDGGDGGEGKRIVVSLMEEQRGDEDGRWDAEEVVVMDRVVMLPAKVVDVERCVRDEEGVAVLSCRRASVAMVYEESLTPPATAIPFVIASPDSTQSPSSSPPPSSPRSSSSSSSSSSSVSSYNPHTYNSQ